MRGRGGGSKAVWNFSENSSDLVAPPFPKNFHVPFYKSVQFKRVGIKQNSWTPMIPAVPFSPFDPTGHVDHMDIWTMK